MQPDTNPDDLLAHLTQEEKALLTAGEGPWRTPAIVRLGIHSMKMTDGSNGARGDRFHGTQSVCFPSGSAVGATWNIDLVEELGEALARESRRKQSNVLLGPTINLHRYPLAGRNFESFGEDPLHVGKMATAAVRGLQSMGVAAVPKHLVANDSEIERESVDVIMDEQTLREVYLYPFELAVREGGAWAVMTAYSKLNGIYCSENAELINGILKDEWGFDGAVISDWGGVDSTVGAANGGLDLEMPGPADYFGTHLLPAVQQGKVDEQVLDDKVVRLLRLAGRTGALDAAPGTEISENRPEDRELMRRAAAEAIVLLQNDGCLPLSRSDYTRVAVIGPNAAHTQIQGGGSSKVNPPYSVSILDGVRAAIDDTVEVVYAPGCSIARFTRPLDRTLITTPDGVRGALVEYFRTVDQVRSLVMSEIVDSTQLTWIGAPLEGVPMAETSVTCRFTLEVPEAGTYTLGLITAGYARVIIDGNDVLDSSAAIGGGPHFFGRGSAEARVDIPLEKNQPYEVVLELETRLEKSATAGVILGLLAPEPEDPIGEAVAIARDADMVIMAVGTSDEWEMEGGDRPDISLPGDQAALVEAVAQVNPNTVVLINAGAAVDLPFSESVAAQLFVWFGGQELGNAVADVLFGAVDPGGRLPLSIPQKQEDVVDIHYIGEGGAGWGGAGGTMTHAERGRIGYRHHEAISVPARFPFGHGLSYADIEVKDVSVSMRSSDATVALDLVNRGSRDGVAVPQVYVTQLSEDEPRRLAAFAKSAIPAGQSVHVELNIEQRAFSRWSVDAHEWTVVPGEYRIDVATSAQDTVSSAIVHINRT